jgi:hypothetical protein
MHRRSIDAHCADLMAERSQGGAIRVYGARVWPGLQCSWVPANRLDSKGVKKQNENAAGGEKVSKEASIGVRLL